MPPPPVPDGAVQLVAPAAGPTANLRRHRCCPGSQCPAAALATVAEGPAVEAAAQPTPPAVAAAGLVAAPALGGEASSSLVAGPMEVPAVGPAVELPAVAEEMGMVGHCQLPARLGPALLGAARVVLAVCPPRR
mmetsp:Transcript_40301/g.125627  ORF Transcript_40301/g.125627 Transcript_40301/m.125627 type:complete len:134 (-) Transcript_40301:308-709(-)